MTNPSGIHTVFTAIMAKHNKFTAGPYFR